MQRVIVFFSRFFLNGLSEKDEWTTLQEEERFPLREKDEKTGNSSIS